ncbi:MAG: Uma2 family endonuclease [Microcoleaceae cyanobacterium]
MPPESELNRRIATFLFAYFLKQGVPSYQLTLKTEVAVLGSRATVRLPGLILLSEDLAISLEVASRSTITLEMPPPRLVVEVVSPGKENEDRDYRYKRSEYGARGIAEYWIVDPMRKQMTVLEWVDGLYEEAVFQETQPIASPEFPDFSLTMGQILQGMF